MTTSERLQAAGWQKVRATGECGEALTASGASLDGLACKKGATWAKDGEADRCAQHAAKLIDDEPECDPHPAQGWNTGEPLD